MLPADVDPRILKINHKATSDFGYEQYWKRKTRRNCISKPDTREMNEMTDATRKMLAVLLKLLTEGRKDLWTIYDQYQY